MTASAVGMGSRTEARPSRGPLLQVTKVNPTHVSGLNAGYVAELFRDFLDAPSSVPAEWRRVFESGERAPAT
ncbi:MAG: hypothetical protein FJW96_15625, partial [Actinobacteria bacterium]|nr:hypothetical protein [Actinomycetota bacterium]